MMRAELVGAFVVSLLAEVALAGPVCPKQLVAGAHAAIPLGGDALATVREGATLTLLPTPLSTVSAGRRVRVQGPLGPGDGTIYLVRAVTFEPGLVGDVGAELSAVRFYDGIAVYASVLGDAPTAQISCASVSGRRPTPPKLLADNAWIGDKTTLLEANGKPTGFEFWGAVRLLGRKGTLAHVSRRLGRPGLRYDGWVPAAVVVTGRKLPPSLDSLVPAMVSGEDCPDVEVAAGAVLHQGAVDDAGVTKLAVVAQGKVLRAAAGFQLVRVRRPDPDLAVLEGWVKEADLKRVPCAAVGSDIGPASR